MILDKKIEIKCTQQYLSILLQKGYDVKVGEKILITLEDLQKTSKYKVNVQCSICNTNKKIEYRYYIKSVENGGYYTCSSKCSTEKKKNTCLEKYGVCSPMQSNLIKEKSKQTNLENYGVEYATQSNLIKEKTKQTNLDKYGAENIFQVEEFKNKSKQTNLENYGVEYATQSNLIKEKTKQTNFKKYGVVNPFQSEEIKNKIKVDNLKKYGCENRNKSVFIKNKIEQSNKNKYSEYYYQLFDNNEEYKFIKYDVNDISLFHNKCGTSFKISTKNIINRNNSNNCLCTVCYPVSEQKSIKEKELSNWLKSLNINFIEKNRDVLKPKELDIYIPSCNLAIEFNGLYWHSEFYQDKNYHLDKSFKCQEQGIQLLHIWEDEWVFKKDIVKSIILNKLNLISEKIYARQCEIRIIDNSKLVKDFLDTNHIQGYCQSSIKLGLFKDNELVSLMTFGKRMIKSNVEFELIRFCNKINLNVIGSASKLFNYFKSNYQFESLISYSDFRLFDGKMYQTLGFTKKHLSKPDYFWCKGLERKHRFNFNKQKLIREGFDPNKTEVEIMHERGYFRVFGCGQYRWEQEI